MMDILLNSGAFSAWKLGERIDLDKYVGFAKVNQRHIYRPINLDVIPGSFGSREWRPMSIEAAAAEFLREPAKDERNRAQLDSGFPPG